MHEIALNKSELERMLDRERRELYDTKAQLKLVQNAMVQWEQEYFNTEKDISVKQELEVVALVKERNLLSDKIKHLEVFYFKNNFLLIIKHRC